MTMLQLRALALCAAFALLPQAASAAEILLYDYGLHVDGLTHFTGDPLPGGLDASGFDFGAGLGSLTLQVNGIGSHTTIAWFDHDIDQDLNTFFNETGADHGVLAAGQSFEIDEPGWVSGDIWDHVNDGALDNAVGASTYGDTSFPDDVSLALGWDFDLAADELATIQFLVALDAPQAGFYLSHTDPDSEVTLYMSSLLEITGGRPDPEPEPDPDPVPHPQPIPEPTTIALFSIGAAVAARRRLRRRASK